MRIKNHSKVFDGQAFGFIWLQRCAVYLQHSNENEHRICKWGHQVYLNQVCIFMWLGILKLNSQKLFCSLLCLCVFSVFYCENGTHLLLFSLLLFLVIGSSFLLPLLPLSFVSLNKAANSAWKWWQHSHAYRQTLSLLCVAVCKWKYTFTRMRESHSFTHLIYLL